MLSSLAQLLVFVELARSVQIQIKNVICCDLLVCRVHLDGSAAGRLKRGDYYREDYNQL